MAQVLVTLKIMPESVDVSLDKLEMAVRDVVKKQGGEVAKVEQEPVAFGLVALQVIVVWDESKGATDPLEEKLKSIAGVLSAEAVDVRRAFG